MEYQRWIRLMAIILKITLDVSGQSFEVTQNSTSITCAGEAVQYTCKSTSSFVQWIVEPVNASAPDIPAMLNSIAAVMGPVNITDDLIVELVAIQPVIITTLTVINRGSFDVANVICRSVADPTLNDSLLFDSGNGGIMDPPSELKLKEMPADFEVGAFEVKFEGSTDENIAYYICNCSGNTCEQTIIDANQFSAILEVSAGVINRRHSVSLYAVDICGTVSDPATAEIWVNTIEGYTVTVILFPFTGALLIAIIAVLIETNRRYYILLKRCREQNCQETQDLKGEHKELTLQEHKEHPL